MTKRQPKLPLVISSEGVAYWIGISEICAGEFWL